MNPVGVSLGSIQGFIHGGYTISPFCFVVVTNSAIWLVATFYIQYMTGTRQGHNAKHEHLPKNRLSVLSAQNEEENSKCVGAGMEACCQQEGRCYVKGDLTVGKAIGEDALAAVGPKRVTPLYFRTGWAIVESNSRHRLRGKGSISL